VNRFIVTFFIIFSTFISINARAETIGPSGQKLPRYLSVKDEKANMRTGPGRQYPIKWTYTRSLLPLEVIDEHGPWRKVRDHENVEGWMHVVLLSGKRTAMIRGRVRSLYKSNDLNSPLLLTVEPGVIGQILECSPMWCRLEIESTKAWVEKRHIWGVYNYEELE